MEKLKILTLNCWGVPIPVVCKQRPQRMAAIAQELAKGEHHVVVLEEIWLKSDYKLILDSVSHVYPNSHYFYSGPIGSGICVFSKLPIIETFFHGFHLNGQAYKVQHGDWFGGKGVGLCHMQFHGIKINLYVTHIHAEYNRADDEYLPHRVAQAFEMSQFIRHTSANCDVILAVGDFNLESGDVGYKLITTNTPLLDAWENKVNAVDDNNPSGSTCDCPFNPYQDSASAAIRPNGKRIDYIMYRSKPGVKVVIDKCVTTMGMVPGQKYPYSDHEAVAAVLTLTRANEADSQATPVEDDLERMQYIEEACTIVKTGITQVRHRAFRWQLRALGLSVLIFWLSISNFEQANPPAVMLVLSVVRPVLVVVVAAIVWLTVVVHKSEGQGLQATQYDMEWLLIQTKKRED